MISQKEFSRRRNQLMRMMGKDSIAIIPTATEQIRNRDVEFPFRPDSDFCNCRADSQTTARRIPAVLQRTRSRNGNLDRTSHWY